MRLPTWDEFARVEEQLNVLESPLDKSLFVVGPPGSGKTVLAMHRAKMMSNMKTEQPIAIVTYNRMLRHSLSLLSENSIEAYTMHSFVGKDYTKRTKTYPPEFERYVYDWKSMHNCLQDKRAGYSKSHLIVDEGQDLPQEFFEYVSRHVSRTMTVFADEDQALTDQRTTLEQIKTATGMSDPIILKQNHRNTPEISRLAEHFHSGRLPSATVHRRLTGEKPRLVQMQGLESTATFVSNWHQNRGGNIGVIVDGTGTGNEMHHRLTDQLKETRVDFYTNQQRNEESIKIFEPGVTILNARSAKGQEFDTVFILELEKFIPCRSDSESRVMYMLCARAKDYLFLMYGPDSLSAEAMATLPESNIIERA